MHALVQHDSTYGPYVRQALSSAYGMRIQNMMPGRRMHIRLAYFAGREPLRWQGARRPAAGPVGVALRHVDTEERVQALRQGALRRAARHRGGLRSRRRACIGRLLAGVQAGVQAGAGGQPAQLGAQAAHAALEERAPVGGQRAALAQQRRAGAEQGGGARGVGARVGGRRQRARSGERGRGHGQQAAAARRGAGHAGAERPEAALHVRGERGQRAAAQARAQGEDARVVVGAQALQERRQRRHRLRAALRFSAVLPCPTLAVLFLAQCHRTGVLRGGDMLFDVVVTTCDHRRAHGLTNSPPAVPIHAWAVSSAGAPSRWRPSRACAGRRRPAAAAPRPAPRAQLGRPRRAAAAAASGAGAAGARAAPSPSSPRRPAPPRPAQWPPLSSSKRQAAV